MISYSMKKYKILIIILILTIFLFGIVFLFNDRTRYNNLVKSNEEWNEIISKRLESDNVSIESMSFNDYPLIVDNEHNKIYYSFVESANKYNPFVKFDGNQDDLKLLIRKELSSKVVNQEEKVEILIYSDKEYRLYTLTVTKNPIININYEDISTGTTSGNILVIDNRLNANQKVIRTDASITLIDNDNNYLISMRKESVGRNKRKNDISIFGITMSHEFELIYKDLSNDSSNTILDLFINNEYKGIYLLEYKEQIGG